MTSLHVVPDERGKWHVFDEARPAPLSEHSSATEAERSAWSHFQELDAHEILVHDRYRRTRPPVRFDAPPTVPARTWAIEDPTF